MRPANERWRYSGTPSLIGWAHTQNDSWNFGGIHNKVPQSQSRKRDNNHAIYKDGITQMAHNAEKLYRWQKGRNSNESANNELRLLSIKPSISMT